MLCTKLSVAKSIKDNVHCHGNWDSFLAVKLGLSPVMNVNISMKFIFLICVFEIFELTLNEGIQTSCIILLLCFNTRLKPYLPVIVLYTCAVDHKQ